jgi:hypothetical protein
VVVAGGGGLPGALSGRRVAQAARVPTIAASAQCLQC